tara:strand:+ start:2835 stop:3629 length:795 start_codon:yes stop_codon:yes gene_type:complete
MNKDFLNKPILHGRSLCGEFFNSGKFKKVRVPKKLHIVTVVDNPEGMALARSKCNIHTIHVDIFKNWMTKIESVFNYMSANYDILPRYIMYLDGYDTLIINKLPNIGKLLSYYKCKVLFNCEYGYWNTGPCEVAAKHPEYYTSLLTYYKAEYITHNINKYGFEQPVEPSLNAGAFVGEKSYIFNLLKHCIYLSKADASFGFPFGCLDDQNMLKYLHLKNFDDISIDVFHKLFFWGTSQSLDDERSDASPDYFRKIKNNYDEILI